MKYLINLLPEKKKDATELILYFSIHYLRYILVITQFVAICVFFYRFKIDQDIVDLKDQFQQKQSIVRATEPLIAHVNAIDEKTNRIRSLIDRQQEEVTILQSVLLSIPSDISIRNLSYLDKTVRVEGETSDPDLIDSLNSVFLQKGEFKTVELSNIDKKEDIYSFTLNLSKNETASSE